MSAQEAPEELQCCVGPVPPQPPGETARICPWYGLPLSDGGESIVGAAIVPTNRIRSFCSAAIRTSPAGVTATAFGIETAAALAGPPSPEKPMTPFPARVVIVPPARRA
jgi:hypothetical protein